jgi:phosphoribosylanthranilate isomerase
VTPKVKICGITNLKDAKIAVRYGADALGFVFYEKSPRYIDPKIAREIVEQLPPFVEKVGLFVNTSPLKINLTCKQAGMSLAQIYFDDDEKLYENLDLPHIKVIRAMCKQDIKRYENEYKMVDAFVEGFGGKGKRVDALWFASVDCSRIILAGGLNAQNIDEMKKYNFYGFDVSSGVEKSKGIKDERKIKEFIDKVKN